MSIKSLGIVILAFAAQVGYASTVGSITIQGVVPQTLSIIVSGVSPYSALDLTTSQTDLMVALVSEQSNSKTGYTVTVSSLNGGKLMNSNSSSSYVTYTAKYGNGSSFNLSSTTTITNQSNPGIYNMTAPFKVTYTGQPATNMLEGTYSDTLTFTIAAK